MVDATPPASNSSCSSGGGSVVDPTKLKSWYKAFSKAANEQLQWARDNILKRPSCVQNDPLGGQRSELEAFDRMVQALLSDVEKFSAMVEAFRSKEVAALTLLSTCRVTEIEWDQSAAAVLEAYGRDHSEAARRVLEFQEGLSALQTTVKHKVGLLYTVKKQFEHRDRLFLRAQEETKRWHRARDTGDPKLVERRRKAETAEAEFAVVSEEIGRSFQTVLQQRNEFISGVLTEFRVIQRSFYSDLGAIFSSTPRVEQWSPSQQRSWPPAATMSMGNLRADLVNDKALSSATSVEKSSHAASSSGTSGLQTRQGHLDQWHGATPAAEARHDDEGAFAFNMQPPGRAMCLEPTSRNSSSSVGVNGNPFSNFPLGEEETQYNRSEANGLAHSEAASLTKSMADGAQTVSRSAFDDALRVVATRPGVTTTVGEPRSRAGAAIPSLSDDKVPGWDDYLLGPGGTELDTINIDTL